MAYADYGYYVAAYRGDVLTESNFDKYAERASDYIDYITSGQAANYNDSHDLVKKCCCAMAEQQLGISNARLLSENGEIASETVGSHSVSYRSGAETVVELEKGMWSIALQYLTRTGLLYRGVPCIRHI